MIASHFSPDSLELVPPSYEEILRFTIPLMLGLMTVVLMTLIDTFFIGQLGTVQLAAVPLASWVYLIGWALLVGVLENSIAFLARAFGAKEYHKMGTFWHIIKYSLYWDCRCYIYLSKVGLYFPP